MLNSTFRQAGLVVVFILAVVFFQASFAHAIDEALLRQVKEQIREVLKEGMLENHEACGGYASVRIEETIATPKGVTNHPISSEWQRPWGCNPSGGGGTPGNPRPVSSQIQDGDTTTTMVAVVQFYFNYDREKSATLKGRVTKKDGKPYKGVTVEASGVYDYLNQHESATTDDNGDYEMQVTSGEYMITAKSGDCKKSERRRLCGFGEATSPAPESPHKHEPYVQDFKLECGQYALSLTGPYQTTIDVHGEGAMGNVSAPGNSRGRFPLRVDVRTGAISGEGTMTMTPGGISEHMNYTDPWGIGSGQAGATPRTDNYKVHGTLQGEMAQITMDCVSTGAVAVNADMTYTDAEGVTRASRSATAEGGGCSDWAGHFKFSIPWQAGATYHHDNTWSKGEEGFTASIHEMYTFSLEEDKS